MRRAGVITASIAAGILIITAAAFAIFFNYSSKKAVDIHKSVSEDYTSLCDNIANTQVTILENGETVGTYSLEELGLLDKTLENTQRILGRNKLYSDDEFKDLTYKQKANWCNTVNPTNQVTVDTSDADLSPVLDDLKASERTETHDAYIYYENESYHIAPEVQGNDINDEAVRDYISDKVKDINIDRDNSGSISLDITEIQCYKAPAVTTESDFDFNEIFQDDLKDLTIDVKFHNDTVKLSSNDIKKYLSVENDGHMKVDTDGLYALVEDWAETHTEENTPYLFNSYVDGPVPLDFVRCNYTVDTESTVNDLIEHMLNFDSTPIDVKYNCCDRRGNPFDISSTYVEVDIKNQHLVFYKNDELVVDTDIVTGRPGGHETPTGLFHAYDKQTDRWLIGADYCVFVDYWVRIYGHYGLHDANWRSEFGGERYLTNGSHGCVNIPNSAMAVIFENIENGDPVLVH